METFPVIVFRHILNIIGHSVQMGWKKQQRRLEQPNIQTVTGRKHAAQMDCEKAPLEKMSVNMALVAFYWPN